MIESAIALSAGKITGAEIQKILDLGHEMLVAEVQPYENVSEILSGLASRSDLMLITKGDLLEQGNKVDRSGLAGYFRYIEILPEKTVASYGKLLDRYGIAPGDFLMVGNSLKSDILPVLEIGGNAIYIPSHNTWAHEEVDPNEIETKTYHELAHLGQLPGLIARLKG